MRKFKDLRVWNEGMDLAVDIYGITRKGAFSEDYGLCRQIQKAAVSISSNIAEGDERGTNQQSIYFRQV